MGFITIDRHDYQRDFHKSTNHMMNGEAKSGKPRTYDSLVFPMRKEMDSNPMQTEIR